MSWVVDNFIKQFIVAILQHLIEFCQIRRAEDTSFTSSQERIGTLTVCRGGGRYTSVSSVCPSVCLHVTLLDSTTISKHDRIGRCLGYMHAEADPDRSIL